MYTGKNVENIRTIWRFLYMQAGFGAMLKGTRFGGQSLTSVTSAVASKRHIVSLFALTYPRVPAIFRQAKGDFLSLV